MVTLTREDIIQRLNYHNVLDSNGNIIDEERFRNIIRAVFLGWVSMERIKSFWKKEALEESIFQDKKERVRPFYHRPFHYVGFGSKTLFISEKEIYERIFIEEFIPQFITKKEDIDLVRRACQLHSKISDSLIRSHAGCTATDDEFCEGCKTKFSEELLNNHSAFLVPLQVKGYLVIDVSLDVINAFINNEDLIEELEESTCSGCKRFILDYFSYCPSCGEKLRVSNSSSSINREKILNELIAIYLSKKLRVISQANKYLNESFVEVDILISKLGKNLGIEGTSAINLDKSYINKKITTLLFLDALHPENKNSLILWCLDPNACKKENVDFANKLTKGSFEILKPSLSEKIMSNQAVSINQKDLDLLVAEINHVIAQLLIKISIWAKDEITVSLSAVKK